MDDVSTEFPVRELLDEEVASVSGGYSFFTFEINEQLGAFVSEGLRRTQGKGLLNATSSVNSESLERAAVAVGNVSTKNNLNASHRVQVIVDLTAILAESFHRPYELEEQIAG